MAFERKEIDRKEVLTLLGRMYALTATGKGRKRYRSRVARTKREENSRGVEVIGER